MTRLSADAKPKAQEHNFGCFANFGPRIHTHCLPCLAFALDLANVALCYANVEL